MFVCSNCSKTGGETFRLATLVETFTRKSPFATRLRPVSHNTENDSIKSSNAFPILFSRNIRRRRFDILAHVLFEKYKIT